MIPATELGNPAPDDAVAQTAAVAAILTGATDADAADAAGVSRQTVCGWRLHHPAVVGALGAGRRDIWDNAADRLRALLPTAVAVLEVALDNPLPDPQTALAELRLAGLADRAAPLTPTGPTTAAAVVDAEILRRRHEADSLEGFLLTGGPITDHERKLTAADLLAIGAGGE